MKIAISSSGKDLDAQLDPRFGRCRHFLIVDTDNMSFEVFDNENATLGGGAGVQSAQFVAAKGIKAVITGNCGPNAMQVLSAAGVQVWAGDRDKAGVWVVVEEWAAVEVVVWEAEVEVHEITRQNNFYKWLIARFMYLILGTLNFSSL